METAFLWTELKHELEESCVAQCEPEPVAADILEVLDQPWILHNDGGTMVVLSGAKTPHVLKLFKSADGYIRKYRFWNIDLASAEWASHPGDERRCAQFQIERTRRSSQLAWRELRTRTGLVYGHLAPTKDPISVSIEDENLRIESKPFLLQYRVELCADYIRSKLQLDDYTSALRTVDAYLQLLTELWRKKVTPSQFYFLENTGFRGDDLIHVDVGDFSSGWESVFRQITRKHILDQGIQPVAKYSKRLASDMEERVAAVFRPELYIPKDELQRLEKIDA